MMAEIPQGWVSVKLGEIADITYGKGLPTKNLKPEGFPVFGANGVIGFFNEYLFEEPQLLISCRGANSGTINFSPSRCFVTNNSLIVDFPLEQFQLRKTLFYFLVAANKERLVTGTAQPQVTINNAVELELCLPPLPEQHRIVAKIEELFSELDQGVASLKTAREQLKVYRQSLLKNAFEGKLTAAWRAAHRDQLETAAALQQRIARERQARYQQQLADWQTAGQSGPKPKPPKPLPPLTAEELAELPELPAGWGWLRIDEVVAESLIGLDRGAKDQTPEAPGIPYVKMNNVSMDGHVFTNKLVYIQATSAELNKFALEEGDILFNTRNSRELVGKSGIVRKLLSPTVYNNNLMRIRVSQSVDPLFLSLQMTGGNFKGALERAKKGTTNVAAVYAKDFFPLPVAVACSNEQIQVVEILESKLSEADQLDQTLATALQQADALRQSILKKAFCGQLVKQDKNDEPATALLERIRAARAASPAKGRQAKLVSKSLTNC